jgi:hypothetical protein
VPFSCICRLQDDVFKYSVWVHTIFGVKTAMRDVETSDVKDETFQPGLSVVSSDGVVESLAIKFKGKNEKGSTKVTLQVHADWDLSFLCPVRALLTWLYLIKWKSGNVFPSKEELKRNLEVCYYISFNSSGPGFRWTL